MGSLYEPVQGERFDVILANPPFVPSPEMGLAFRDGGVRGESTVPDRRWGGGAPQRTGSDRHRNRPGDISGYAEKLRRCGDTPAWMRSSRAPPTERCSSRFPLSCGLRAIHRALSARARSLGAELPYSEAEAVNFGYILVALGGLASFGEQARDPQPRGPCTRRSRTGGAASHAGAPGRRRFLPLPPSRRSHHAHSHASRGGDCYEVSVPGSDFFTTYAVSERVYAELCHIAKVRPRLGEVLREGDGWLESLMRIGVLRLEPTPPLQEEVTPTDAPDIVEQATKTTPTCLSSYLG